MKVKFEKPEKKVKLLSDLMLNEAFQLTSEGSDPETCINLLGSYLRICKNGDLVVGSFKNDPVVTRIGYLKSIEIDDGKKQVKRCKEEEDLQRCMDDR